MFQKKPAGDDRPEQQRKEHYEIEVELADRLRNSSAHERRSLGLYTTVYDELFRRVPRHQQLAQKSSPEDTAKAVAWQLGLVRRFVGKSTVFLEVGPGDCALSFRIAGMAKKVFAVDVSSVIAHNSAPPPNFSLSLSDGCSMPAQSESIDVAYSNQLMEHLHPDDAREQLQNIFDVLKPGGFYVCVTPNRVAGPADISVHYDQVARGFHLKEYTFGELADLFKEAGFKELRAYVGARGKYVRFPIRPIVWLENALLLLPFGVRSRVARSLLFRVVLGVRIVGGK